jgi:hypothetical protein
VRNGSDRIFYQASSKRKLVIWNRYRVVGGEDVRVSKIGGGVAFRMNSH